MKKLDTTTPNAESGQAVAKQKTASKFSSTYWTPRVFRPEWARKGEGKEGEGKTRTVLAFWARVQHAGRREKIALGTNDRKEAANKAADFYKLVASVGWEKALQKFAPDRAAPTDATTFGQLVEMATRAKCADVSPRTLRDYQSAARNLVALAMDIRADESRFDYVNGGRDAWISRIDGIKLAEIRADKIQGALNQRIAASRSNPVQEQHTRASCASLARMAKALFHGVKDCPNPFADVSVSTPEPPKYHSSVSAKALIAAARAELADTEPEAYKAFLLAIGAGLRRREIDCLTWGQIDADKGCISIMATPYFKPKSKSSIGDVYVDGGLIAELLRFKPEAAGLFVLESEFAPRPDATYNFYRAEKAFNKLNAWLKSKGVLTQKPLHTMRKEFGSLVNELADIHTAKSQLRHSAIGITSKYYTDNRKRVAPPIGSMLEQKSA